MNNIIHPPGPKSFLSLLNVYQFRKNPLKFFTKLAGKYGDIIHFKLGPQSIILLNEPDQIKDVLLTNNAKFIKGRALEMAKVVLGEGLLTSENPTHLRQRRIIQPEFNHKRISFYGTIMAEYAEHFQQRWCDGETVDISQEMMSLTLEIVAKTLFDTDVKSEKKGIQEALTIIVEMFTELTNPFVNILRKLPLPKQIKFNKAKNYLDSTIMKMLEERRSGSQNKEDLLSLLLRAQDLEGDKKGMNDQQIRDEAITIFLAGHETTANMLSWTWYLLSQHPEVEEKLLNEFEEILGNKLPTPEDVSKLVYTKKVLTEAMRLYPPAWAIGRRNIEPYNLKEFQIPVNTVFVMSQYIMHRDARYYDDPVKFNPERWNEQLKAKLPKFAYFPFGGGNRICIGEQFAWMEGTLLLTILAQKWKMELVPGQNIELLPLITLRPKNGIKMRLKKRG